jgi:hypothetical protein
MQALEVELGRVGLTYGGKARFGRRSMRISSSLGGGIRFSGDHTLMGVFQGTTGFETSLGFGGAVDAWRNAGKRWRHCNCVRGHARRVAGNIRGGGIVDVCCAIDAGEKRMVTRSVDAWRGGCLCGLRGGLVPRWGTSLQSAFLHRTTVILERRSFSLMNSSSFYRDTPSIMIASSRFAAWKFDVKFPPTRSDGTASKASRS